MRLVSRCLTLGLIAIGGVLTGCDSQPEIMENLPQPSAIPDRPDFKAFTDTKAKKKAFFDYLYPMIERANLEVISQRQELIMLRDQTLSADQQKKLAGLCDQYRANCNGTANDDVDTLLEKVGLVPPSLTLAQAANESAWGTSRFALQANNFFGQWCFTKGCGVVPKARGAGQTHEVRKFDSPMESVRGYVFNINSSPAYQELRDRRKNNASHSLTSGTTLAKGLSKYSERGDDYIEEVSHMIRTNKLDQYDEKFTQLMASAN